MASHTDITTHNRDCKRCNIATLAPSASLEQLVAVLDRGLVGVIVDGETLLGLVTRIDLVNYLRRRVG